MTPTPEQIAGNILIAINTGWTFKEDQPELYPNGYYTKEDDKDWSSAEDLKFHSDWNWLMDVLIEIGIETCNTDINYTWQIVVDELKAQSN